jgi:hypothetical protein
MSLEKAIQYKKEKRQPFYDSRRFDHSCRNHGTCSWCVRNRTYRFEKSKHGTDGQIDEWFGYWGYPDPSDINSQILEEQAANLGMSEWELIRLEEEYQNSHSNGYFDEKSPLQTL